MNWTRIALGISDLLSIALVIRLVNLRLHAVYRIFCAFLLVQVVSESFVFIERFTALNHVLDYRVIWLVFEIAWWLFSLWMVYALLQDILVQLPGILRFSRKVLNVVVPLSFVVAFLSAAPEYLASGAGNESSLAYLVNVAFIMDRVVATIALLSLLSMLFFVLWFPVKMPRNLALFSAGFAVYFTAKTALLLAQRFWPRESRRGLDLSVTLILCICLLYWIIFLNKRGESVPVTVGHRWQAERQTKLVNDLEHLNAVLARAGRR